MAERSTATTMAEIMIPVAAGAVIIGAVATLVWLSTREAPRLSGTSVAPHPRRHRPPTRLSPKAFTDGDDPGYDLEVEGEDVT